MKEEKYSQILSTYEGVQVEPDTTNYNSCFKNIMIQCRICLEQHGPFIIPCKCDGTMKYVHEGCLKKWASERLKKQVKKQEQQANGQLSSVHGIQCELCKQNISMQVRKLKRFVGWDEAKEDSEQYFLPFVPLVMLNVTISLGCMGGVISAIVFSLLMLFKNQSIDYRKYEEHPLMVWSIVGLALVFCAIFMVKSIVQLYYMFIREEHQVIRVIASLQETPFSKTESIKTTQADYKELGNIDTLPTPTSPQGSPLSVNDRLLQNKLSITRKNITLRQKIARQIAERKLAKLKQFKNTPSQNTTQPDKQTSLCSVISAK